MLSDNVRGAVLMMTGMAAYALSDSVMKLLSPSMPMFQTLAWRGLGVTLILGVIAWRAGAFRVRLDTRDRWLVILRTACDTGSVWFFLQALYHMPIANVTAIVQALPLTVTLGAALFLGEPVGWRRLLAIAVGFLGVLLVVRPQAGAFDIHAIYALICVAFVTARELFTRRVSRGVPSLLIAWLNGTAVMVFGLLGSLGETFTPPDAATAPLLVVTSLAIVAGYLMAVMAVRTGELAFVTPFRYAGLVWALLLGLALFAEWPDPVTLLGAALIVFTGLFTFYRERVTARRLRRGIPRGHAPE